MIFRFSLESEIKKNFIFFAIKGTKQDGHQFINEAIKKGAILIIIDNKKRQIYLFFVKFSGVSEDAHLQYLTCTVCKINTI